MFLRVLFLVLVLGGSILNYTLSTQVGVHQERTVWDRIYTLKQASLGQEAYNYSCRSCHKDDLKGIDGRLRNPRFLEDWRENSMERLFSRTKAVMPATAPDSLSDAEYLDIIAYILQMNSFPPGVLPLQRQALSSIRIEGRNGPQPLPNNAPVQLAGCLAEQPVGSWQITDATDLVRSLTWKFSDSELKDLQEHTPGTKRYQLI
jgi:S-disulfanyl-L-cysteine oxidoreductase SoxD